MPPDWTALVAKKREAEAILQRVEKEMRAYASTVLLESFKKGKWKVGSNCYNPHLVPIDKDAEDVIEEILSVALKMGYHDRFTLTDGHVEIEGQVNDGVLTLSLDIGMRPNPDAIQNDLKRLQLDFDITNLIRNHTKSALRSAESNFRRAQEDLTAIQKSFAKLPPGITEDEEDEE